MLPLVRPTCLLYDQKFLFIRSEQPLLVLNPNYKIWSKILFGPNFHAFRVSIWIQGIMKWVFMLIVFGSIVFRLVCRREPVLRDFCQKGSSGFMLLHWPWYSTTVSTNRISLRRLEKPRPVYVSMSWKLLENFYKMINSQ